MPLLLVDGEGRIVRKFSLWSNYIGNKDVIFFFFPKDFTFVCPTEISLLSRKAGSI